MELKNALTIGLICLLLVVGISQAVTQKVYVDTNYNLYNLFNITNIEFHGNISNGLVLILEENITTPGWFIGMINWSDVQSKFITAVDDNYIYMSTTTATLNITKLINTVKQITVLVNDSQTLYTDAQDVLANESLVRWSDDKFITLANEGNLNTNHSDLSEYSGLQSVPSACSPSYGVDNLSYPVTCTHFMLGTGDEVTGDYKIIGDFNVTGDTGIHDLKAHGTINITDPAGVFWFAEGARIETNATCIKIYSPAGTGIVEVCD